MEIFKSRVAIAAAIVVVAGMGWFGLKRYKDAHTADAQEPTNGSINGNVYTNNFFQFTVQFPAGWRVVPMESHPQVNAKGMLSYGLLLVGSLDGQGHGAPPFVIRRTPC